MEYDKYTTAGASVAYADRDVPQPANALDSIASALDEIEIRLRTSGHHAAGIADRIFGSPVPLNQASSKGETAAREPVNIPAIMNRLERVHMAIGDLDGSLARLAGL